MAPSDMAASTTVAVSVWMTPRVTNEVDTVTGDVNQGIQMPFATKVRSLGYLTYLIISWGMGRIILHHMTNVF